MNKNKIVSLKDAVGLIGDRETVFVSGFGTNGVPDYLLEGLAERHAQSQSPRELTVLFGGGPGDGADRGINRIARQGLVRRAVGGHWGLAPKMGALAVAGEIEAWNYPLGVVSHLLRDMARGLPGTVTRVGLDTFADPVLDGCRVNDRSKEELVSRVTLGGEEVLFYRALPISVALLRGTTADAEGNVTLERETLTQDVTAAATAAKNAGGLVILQVERIAETGAQDPRRVKIPGILVDCVVVSPPDRHPQTFGTPYSPAFSAEIRMPLDAAEPMPLTERKVIARRAAFELVANAVVNLGIGMPEGVAAVANEERALKFMTLTAEPGLIGGMPQSGLDFGAAVNPAAVIDMNQQFDLYDGGGLDLAFLGLAQCDRRGNVNVSRFGPRLAGAGGFINITQNARKLIYMGTFTAGGLDVRIEDNAVRIESEGRTRKFLSDVEQVTFSGPRAARLGQLVLFVTERCVFRLTGEGLELSEIAPGVDIERDILVHMDFEPIVNAPVRMDSRIFSNDPMGLKEMLLELPLERRLTLDAAKNTIFINFEGLHVSSLAQVEQINEAVESICAPFTERVAAVVNYDTFTIAEYVLDAYAAMVAGLEERFYTHVTRYTTSAFLKAKLGESLSRRGIAPHLFDSGQAIRDRERFAYSGGRRNLK